MENWSDDIYFDEKYGTLNSAIELGEPVCYVLKCDYGIIINLFIKRKIPLNNVVDDWYDIRTPYGYGGPLIISFTNKEMLLKEYEKDFSNFCRVNNIITEFVRFHPLANNAADFRNIYEISLNRHTVGTNLKISDNPIELEFSKSCRKNIRRALNHGITYKVVTSPENLDDFIRIYYDTMKRNNAAEYYYFDRDYFNKLINYFRDSIVVVYVFLNNIIVSAGLCFVSHKILHIHLSGTLNEYLHLNPNYVLRYAAAKWAFENNLNYIHHGGGRTNLDTDSLYVYKKQFGINTSFDFYLGEKIWNKYMYNIISEQKYDDETINDYIRRLNRK